MADGHESVIESLHEKDPVAVQVLLERHLPGLEAYLRLHAGLVVRERETPRDLVQSVCREVLEAADGFEYQGEAAFRNWLFTRAHHKISDRLRHWKSEKRDVAREDPRGFTEDQRSRLEQMQDSMPTPSQLLADAEELDRLEATFPKLDEDYRTVIIKSRIIGLSHREIGEEMGRSEEASRKLLARAIVKLGELMGAGKHGD